MPVPVCIKCLVTSKYHYYYYPFKTPLHLVSSHWGCFINISWGMVKAIAFQCEKAGGFPDGTSGKEPTCQCRRCKEMGVQSLGQEDPLEEGTATHFSILAWKIPWRAETGRLSSTVLQRVGHDWSNLVYTRTHEKAKTTRTGPISTILFTNKSWNVKRFIFLPYIYIYKINLKGRPAKMLNGWFRTKQVRPIWWKHSICSLRKELKHLWNCVSCQAVFAFYYPFAEQKEIIHG